MQTNTIHIDETDAGQRLDKALTLHLPEFSRSRLQQLIEQGHVRLGDATITDANRKVKSGEYYSVNIPAAVPSQVAASDIPLSIIYEDEDLLVIDKPAGMTVHPAPGHTDDTLVNALLSHCGESLSGIGGVQRPGIVHRIDKDTSGLLVVAKNDAAHQHLSAQLATRALSREYLCIVKGMPVPPQGTITANIARSNTNRKKMAVVKTGGREAVTHYKLLQRLNNSAFLQCNLETGRTHQIRVHLAHIGHSIIGDTVYGRKLKGLDFPRQALHAARLKLIHPRTDEEMEFTSELPEDMRELMRVLAPT
jgi:23S rRNA pseudouridine1911/1915/1917 synthase